MVPFRIGSPARFADATAPPRAPAPGLLPVPGVNSRPRGPEGRRNEKSTMTSREDVSKCQWNGFLRIVPTHCEFSTRVRRIAIFLSPSKDRGRAGDTVEAEAGSQSCG